MSSRWSTDRLITLSVCVIAMVAVACDRRVDDWVDAADEPPRVERVRVPGLEKPVPRQRPAAQPPTTIASDAPKSGAGAPIRGTLSLGDRVSPPPDGTVFVIARGGGGPPLAVVRLPIGPFPMSFEIGPQHVMIPGRQFVAPITLSARVDADGDPLTRDPADLSAAHPEPLTPGAAGIDLQLRPQG